MSFLTCLLLISSAVSVLGQQSAETIEALVSEAAYDVLGQHSDEMSRWLQPPDFNPPGGFMRSFVHGTGVGNREELSVDTVRELRVFHDTRFVRWLHSRFNNTDYLIGMRRGAVSMMKTTDLPQDSDYFAVSVDDAVFDFYADYMNLLLLIGYLNKNILEILFSPTLTKRTVFIPYLKVYDIYLGGKMEKGQIIKYVLNLWSKMYSDENISKSSEFTSSDEELFDEHFENSTSFRPKKRQKFTEDLCRPTKRFKSDAKFGTVLFIENFIIKESINRTSINDSIGSYVEGFSQFDVSSVRKARQNNNKTEAEHMKATNKTIPPNKGLFSTPSAMPKETCIDSEDNCNESISPNPQREKENSHMTQTIQLATPSSEDIQTENEPQNVGTTNPEKEVPQETRKKNPFSSYFKKVIKTSIEQDIQPAAPPSANTRVTTETSNGRTKHPEIEVPHETQKENHSSSYFRKLVKAISGFGGI